MEAPHRVVSRPPGGLLNGASRHDRGGQRDRATVVAVS